MTEPTHTEPKLGLVSALQQLPVRDIHLIVGVLQGLAAYGLIENGEWLSERLHFALPLWLLVLVWPTTFLLCFTREQMARALLFVTGLTLILASLAFYTGWQAMPNEAFESETLVASFVISMLIVVFVALIHMQPRVLQTDAAYEVFFTLSWRNFVTVGFSCALVVGVRLVLFLWESLFAAIGVDFFKQLFERAWFMGPVLGATFAFGLFSFRAATSIIDSVSTLLARLTWLLLPILLLLIASFLCTLPFVGLEPLWDTDFGTFILMAANLLALFFINAVYQTGQRLPYPTWPHRVLTIGIALLPIVSALACYGLLLRVAQYGWSVSRLWAMLVVVLMACFSVGYAYLIVRHRIDWKLKLPDINRHMSWVVLISLSLTASPLLDFRALSAWSLFSRYESGTAQAIDLKYVRTMLGKPGHSRLSALQAEEPDIIERLENDQHLVRGWTEAQLSGILKRPESFDIPDSLSIALRESDFEPPRMLVRVHLNDDDVFEYVAIWGSDEYAYANCWTQAAFEWRHCGHATLDADSEQGLFANLSGSEIESVTPTRPYKDLRIGDQELEFR